VVTRFVRVYIEGGSTGKTADNDFRRGWKKFLDELHRLARAHQFQSLEVVRGKGRGNAFKSFSNHYKRYPQDLCALIVDSEGPVPAGKSVWEVVAEREGDRWKKPAWARSNHLYLMVQMVETWLLTDQDALLEYFKKGFVAKNLPTTNLEQRAKPEIESALKRATQDCSKGPYRHGQAHEVLEYVRPSNVRTLSHGMRLFDELGKLIAEQ
jgi:hypothetical protein